MSRTVDRASGTLSARLLRVVLAVAAFAVMLVPLCADGMLAGEMSMSSARVAVVSSGMVHEGQMTTAMSRPEPPAAPGDGFLVACIVFLVAVLMAACGSRRPRPAGYAVVFRPVRREIVTRSARRLVLAELCVLRA